MELTPIIFNIRQERQKYNYTIAIKKIEESNLNNDINIEEYKRVLNDCKTNINSKIYINW